jgi:hypothetical protein
LLQSFFLSQLDHATNLALSRKLLHLHFPHE